MENSHVLIDSASDELAVSALIARIFFRSSPPVECLRFISGEALLTNVFSIIFCCFLLLTLWCFLTLGLIMLDAQGLICSAVASFAKPLIHLVSEFDLQTADKEIMLIDELHLFGDFVLGVFDL